VFPVPSLLKLFHSFPNVLPLKTEDQLSPLIPFDPPPPPPPPPPPLFFFFFFLFPSARRRGVCSLIKGISPAPLIFLVRTLPRVTFCGKDWSRRSDPLSFTGPETWSRGSSHWFIRRRGPSQFLHVFPDEFFSRLSRIESGTSRPPPNSFPFTLIPTRSVPRDSSISQVSRSPQNSTGGFL